MTYNGFTPTKYTQECDGCHRRFIISQETLDLVKRDVAEELGPVGLPRDEDAIDCIQWCVECVSGEPCPDERLHETDADCAPHINPDTDCCSICGTYHGDPCRQCNGRGFHVFGCNLEEWE